MALETHVFAIQPVGCDGVVGSGVMMDACGVCGGQGRGCRLFEGIFMEPILPKGHQQVTTIPKGAMSLNISELRFSSNFLGNVINLSSSSRMIISGPCVSRNQRRSSNSHFLPLCKFPKFH